jgi:hypothetical protein
MKPSFDILESRDCASGLCADAVAAYNAYQVANYAALIATVPPCFQFPSPPPYTQAQIEAISGFFSGIGGTVQTVSALPDAIENDVPTVNAIYVAPDGSTVQTFAPALQVTGRQQVTAPDGTSIVTSAQQVPIAGLAIYQTVQIAGSSNFSGNGTETVQTQVAVPADAGNYELFVSPDGTITLQIDTAGTTEQSTSTDGGLTFSPWQQP